MKEILECIRSGEISLEEGKSFIQDLTSLKESSILTIIKLVKSKSITPEKGEELLLAQNDKKHKGVTKESKKNKEPASKIKRAARPLERDEFNQIIKLCSEGFNYKDKDGVDRIFRKNKQLTIAFILQCNLGLRVSDVLKLKPSTFRSDKLEVIEKKTGKLQYRDIHPNLKNLIYEYCMEKNLKQDQYIINLTRGSIHKQLKIISDYLGLSNISSHSFRKLFAVTVFEAEKDINLVKEILNHSDVSITQRYLRVQQKKINEVSANIDFTTPLNK